MQITVFLTNDAYLPERRAFTEVRSGVDAIHRIRSAKRVTFHLPDVADADGLLDRIFALTNDVCRDRADFDAAEQYRAGGETRSLSVGDLVHIPGFGIYACQNVGWTKQLAAVERFALTGRAFQVVV